MATLLSVFRWLIDHGITDIAAAWQLVQQLYADFGEVGEVTDEMIDASWAKLNPVPPEGEPPVQEP